MLQLLNSSVSNKKYSISRTSPLFFLEIHWISPSDSQASCATITKTIFESEVPGG